MECVVSAAGAVWGVLVAMMVPGSGHPGRGRVEPPPPGGMSGRWVVPGHHWHEIDGRVWLAGQWLAPVEAASPVKAPLAKAPPANLRAPLPVGLISPGPVAKARPKSISAASSSAASSAASSPVEFLAAPAKPAHVDEPRQDMDVDSTTDGLDDAEMQRMDDLDTVDWGEGDGDGSDGVHKRPRSA